MTLPQGVNFKLTRREWLTLFCVCTVSFSSGICYSLQGPIYPQEATKKGVKAWAYGMVFGVYELVNFIICPMYGKYMDSLGIKFLIVAGMIVGGSSSILFGFLDDIDSRVDFLILSFALRILEAVGVSAAFTASFSVTALMFQENIATTIAILECFFGLGYTLGPTIGGYLYQVGGFLCPFLVVGVFMILTALLSTVILPSIDDNKGGQQQQAYLWSAIKLKPVMLDLFSVVAINISQGFYLATLEPHLRQFHLSPVHVGAIFAITFGIYLITTPLVGRLCDNRTNAKSIIILGSILVIVSSSLIGPLPFLPIPTILWMVYVGMALQGLATSCIVVPGFIDALQSAVQYGLPDDITTYSLITGLSTSSVALGAFIGPTIAGVLFDTVGFRYGSLFIIAVFLLLLLLMTWFVCAEKVSKARFQYSELNRSVQDTQVTSGTEYGSTTEKNVEEMRTEDK